MGSQEVPRPYWVDQEILQQVTNIIETLANFVYLIRVASDDPDKVRSYAEQSEERIQSLGKLVRGITNT
jgi:hypothetical protein